MSLLFVRPTAPPPRGVRVNNREVIRLPRTCACARETDGGGRGGGVAVTGDGAAPGYAGYARKRRGPRPGKGYHLRPSDEAAGSGRDNWFAFDDLSRRGGSHSLARSFSFSLSSPPRTISPRALTRSFFSSNARTVVVLLYYGFVLFCFRFSHLPVSVSQTSSRFLRPTLRTLRLSRSFINN